MKSSISAVVTVARVIQRAALSFAPRHVRTSYRAEMIATFDAASAEAGNRGVIAVCQLLVRELGDIATARRANEPLSIVHQTTSEAPPGASLHEWIQLAAWRQAWRSLSRRPAFLVASALTLGAGAGITTAVFSLVDTVLIKPLPYPDSDRLVMVYESSPSIRDRISLVAPGRLEDWHRLARTFVALSGSYAENVTDTSANEPERLEGRRVTPRFFDVYAMPALAGRSFSEEEEQPDGPGAVVISETFWTRRFDRDPSALGRSLKIGDRSYQIVGVMPRTFTSATTDVWLPAQISADLMRVREARFIGGVARIRPGVSLEAAARDLVSVQESLSREFPATDGGWSAEIRPLKQVRVGNYQRGLSFVFGAVVALWVIVVANIAGLMLVHVHRRAHELAIRSALGASRARVIGTMVREGLLIAVVGGLLAATLAGWMVSAMPVLLPATPRINELTLDWRALVFTIVTNLLATSAFSLLPALAGTRRQLNRTIAMGSRSVAAGHHGLQKLLVIGQVALSVLLVGSATLFLRSYYSLTHVETGFDSSGVVTFHVAARWDEDRGRLGQLQQQLLSNLQQLPHVQAAGMTNFLPATGAILRFQGSVDGLAGPNADGSMTVGARMIGGGYLRAIRAELRAGSWCPDPATNVNAPRTAMVNQRFVDVHAHGETLVGGSLRVVQRSAVPFLISGVIGNLAEDGHATSPVPYVYTCDPAGSWPDPEYVARTSDPRAFATDLRRIVRELDSTRAVFGLRPLQDVLDAALDQPRLDAAMLSFFAGAAVSLAAIGLYSLFMLVVSERSREIAVRLAIGARPREMIRLVMAGAGWLLAAGIGLGAVMSIAADRALRGTVFGVSALDARALAAAAATLAVVSTLAVAGPAFKASRIAPTDALRGD